jgi:TIR domain
MANIFIFNEIHDKNFATHLMNVLSVYGHSVKSQDELLSSNSNYDVFDILNKSDALIFLISKVYMNPKLNIELGAALAYSKQKGKPTIFPIIIGDITLPSIFTGFEFYKTGNKKLTKAGSRIADRINNRLSDLDELEEVEFDNNEPLFLLLGNVDHEGVLSSLRTIGRQYKKKMLESKPENWRAITDYFKNCTVKGVLIKITSRVISLMSQEAYSEVTHELFRCIGNSHNIVFIYENLLTGNFEQKDDDFYQPDELIRIASIKQLESYNLNIMPYRSNAEVTVMAISFLKETEQNLIFRLYVPSGRMWANETDRLLQMFRDYLTRVGHLEIRLDQYRTDKGTIYEFHGEEPKGESGLATEFSEFTQLMDLCITNPTAAETILIEKNVAPREILDILARYSKEAKRIQVDLKQDRERKLLGIRHRLESELVDVLPATTDWNTIHTLVESSIPAIVGSSSAISIDQNPLNLNGTKNITINLKPQFIQAVNGIVAQEIRGDQYLTPQDQELLSLIQQHGREKSAELASAVHELTDKSTPSPNRLNAKQKLKKFLIDIGGHAGDIATGLLQKYIENQLGM